MRTISVVGIGAGDPEHVTVQAINTLNAVDVVFMMDKGEQKRELTDLRRDICERYITNPSYRIVSAADPERDRTAPGYRSAVEDWRRKRAEIYAGLIADELGEDGHGAFLAWGDPAIYDSTLHVLDEVLARGAVDFELQVVPGISSIQALAARHRVSLTRTGRPVHITTGRLLARGFPENADDVVVMLDAGCAFTELDAGGGDAGDLEICWGAYVGSDDEILISGRVAEVGPQIVAAREAARGQHGWIMDSYLLRRPDRRQPGGNQPGGNQPGPPRPGSQRPDPTRPALATGAPVTGSAAAGTPAPRTPATGTPAPRTPATGTPAPRTPATGTPAPRTPATGTPAPRTPATGTPAPRTPATGTPAPRTPATGTPAPRTPATGTPAPRTPATGTPAPRTPATGTPAPRTPATGTPAPRTPATGTPAPRTPATGTPAPRTPATGGRDRHGTVLILGGTGEARDLAARLAGTGGLRVVSSLAGRVTDPVLPAGEVRIGGFGGAAGLTDWLRAEQVTAVVDATHPFAQTISASAATAAAAAGTALLSLAREPWAAAPGDTWHEVGSLPAAARLLPSLGQRAFLTTGRQGLPAFAPLDGMWFLIRCVDPPGEPLPPARQVILARGPYDSGAEHELMRRHAIDVLVTKNSGGPLTAGKLAAARDLGVPVVMVARPPLPDVPRCSSARDAAHWVKQLVSGRRSAGL